MPSAPTDSAPAGSAPAGPPAPARARSRDTTVLVLAVALLACAVYANALRNGFALDDESIIRDNPVVHGLGHLHATLLGAYWETSLQLYRPVTLLSFALEWAIDGGNTTAMHAVNVVLHAVASGMVAALVLRLRGGRAAALLAGAVFAVHPVHVEAVSNLVGRSELISTILALWAALLYLADPQRAARAPLRVAALSLLYFLALGTKEIALPLPALLLVLDAAGSRGERTPAWRIVLRNLPLMGAMAVALGAYLALRVHATAGVVAIAPAAYLRGLPAPERIATAVRIWPEYVRLLFWPRDLLADWGPDVIVTVGWGSPLVWLGLAIGAAAAACAWVSWRRERWIAAAVLWFALLVFPISNIPFAVGVLVAERNLYLPSVALAFLCPPLVAVVARERAAVRRAALALAAVVLALGVVRTWTRTPVWKSSDALFNSMLDSHPELWWVEWKAGNILAKRGMIDQAIPWYQSAMSKMRMNQYIMDMDYTTMLLNVGRYSDAEPVLRYAVRTFPGSVPAYTSLASVLIETGRAREALGVLDRAERVPHFGALSLSDIRTRRALAYDALGQVDSALVQRRLTLEDPVFRRFYDVWYHYARLLQETGDTAHARMALDSARARTAPAIRPLIVLDPLPSLSSALIRGWGPIAAPPPPNAPAVPRASTDASAPR